MVSNKGKNRREQEEAGRDERRNEDEGYEGRHHHYRQRRMCDRPRLASGLLCGVRFHVHALRRFETCVTGRHLVRRVGDVIRRCARVVSNHTGWFVRPVASKRLVELRGGLRAFVDLYAGMKWWLPKGRRDHVLLQ